jgi:hypothetical protein
MNKPSRTKKSMSRRSWARYYQHLYETTGSINAAHMAAWYTIRFLQFGD